MTCSVAAGAGAMRTRRRLPFLRFSREAMDRCCPADADLQSMAATLKAREFVFLCEDLAMASLGEDFPRPLRKVEWTTLQLSFGNPQAHFELQPHVARGIVELGLHFEGPVEFNDACAARIAADAHQVMAALGPAWELEVWTQSWRRIHRVFHFEALTSELGHAVAAEFARALRVLHPYASGV